MRDPRRDPTANDSLSVTKAASGTYTRTVIEVFKAGRSTRVSYTRFSPILLRGAEDHECSLSSWRQWAKNALVEYTAPDPREHEASMTMLDMDLKMLNKVKAARSAERDREVARARAHQEEMLRSLRPPPAPGQQYTMFNPPRRRNPDNRERELERRAAGGDVEAEAALIVARLRQSTIFEEQVRVIATLGDQAAIMALGDQGRPRDLLLDGEALIEAGPMVGAFCILASTINAMALIERGRRLARNATTQRALLVSWLADDGMFGDLRSDGHAWADVARIIQEVRHEEHRGVARWSDAAGASLLIGARAMAEIVFDPTGEHFASWGRSAAISIANSAGMNARVRGATPPYSGQETRGFLASVHDEDLYPVAGAALGFIKPWVWGKGPSSWKVPGLWNAPLGEPAQLRLNATNPRF